MDRRTIITLGFILIIIVGAFTFLLTNPSAKKAMQKNIEESAKQTVQNPTVNSTPATTDTATKSEGKYIDYSTEALASAQGNKVLFFHAPWCPQCRDLESNIKNQVIPEGTTIFKVDYDSNQALRQKYGVTIQTTVVKVDDSGNLVKKYVAYSEPTLDSVIKNLQ